MSGSGNPHVADAIAAKKRKLAAARPQARARPLAATATAAGSSIDEKSQSATSPRAARTQAAIGDMARAAFAHISTLWRTDSPVAGAVGVEAAADGSVDDAEKKGVRAMTTEDFRALRETKRVQAPCRWHNGVVRVFGGYLRKSFKLGREEQASRFYRELQLLERLADSDMAATLAHVDLQRGDLYLTDIGSEVSPIEMIFGRTAIDARRRAIFAEMKRRGILLQSADGKGVAPRDIVPLPFMHRDPAGILRVGKLDDPAWHTTPLPAP